MKDATATHSTPARSAASKPQVRPVTWSFRKPTEDDIRFVLAHMRTEDRREVKRLSGLGDEWALRHSIDNSDVAYAGLCSGEVVCIFGARRVTLVEPVACLWSLSTDAIARHPVEFAIASKAGFDRICRDMPDVEEFQNLMDMEYAAAVRWIQWLGASFAINSARPGRCGGVFKLFYIENPHYKEN